jgi:hypothetical protein
MIKNIGATFANIDPNSIFLDLEYLFVFLERFLTDKTRRLFNRSMSKRFNEFPFEGDKCTLYFLKEIHLYSFYLL